MIKLLIAASVAVLTSTFLLGVLSYQNQAKIEALEKSKDRGKITWRAEMAKAKGEYETVFRSSIDNYAVARSLDEALTHYTLVVAETTESKSYAGVDDIQTWYRFRIIEELSTPTVLCTTCPKLPDPPADFLPQRGEFLASKVGGEVLIDGVRVISKDPKFPRMENGKKYLIFLSLDTSKTVGALRMGPWGTFSLDSNGMFQPIDKSLKHPISDELTNRFANSLTKLRLRLK